MSLFDNLKRDIEKGAKDIANVAEDADGAVDRAVSIANSGYAAVKQDVDRIIAAGETGVLNTMVADVVKSDGDAIKKIVPLLTSDALAALAQVLNDLQQQLLGKHLSSDAEATLNTFLNSSVIQQVKALAAKEYISVSLAGGGNATFMAGLEGCYGGVVALDGEEPRGMVGVGELMGAGEGVEGSVQVGLWKHAPHSLKGGYVAFEVNFGVAEGVGMQLVWSMPDAKFIGFVVAAFGGEEASASLAAGYTYTYSD